MRGTSSMRRRTAAGLQPGDTFTVTRTFTSADIGAFGDLTRDYNPVHYEPRFAAAKGFAGLICHGLHVGSMICEVGGQLAWLATGMSFRFRRPVYPGDTITCRLTVTAAAADGRAEAEAVLTNQNGVVVIEASLSGRVPRGAERELLGAMLAEGDPTNGWRSDR